MVATLGPDCLFAAIFGAEEKFLASPSLQASGHCMNRQEIRIHNLWRI